MDLLALKFDAPTNRRHTNRALKIQNPYGDSQGPQFSASGSGTQYHIGLGLIPGNPNTMAGSGDASLAMWANTFPGGSTNPAFQQAVKDLYGKISNGYQTDYTHAYSAIATAIDQAGKSGLSLSDGLAINGFTNKSGSWDSFSTTRGSNSPSGGSSPINIVMGGGGTPGVSDMKASAELGAYSQVIGTLHEWNLDSLGAQAWSMISDPGYHLNAGEVMAALRNTPEYKAAYPGMAELAAKGLSMTEREYQTYSRDIQDQIRGAKIDVGFLNPQEIGNLVANGIYGSNLTNRIQKGYEAIQNFNSNAKQLLHDWYGVDTGHLLAYVLSPDKGTDQIVKQVQASMIGTEANLAGFNLQGQGKDIAGQLASQMTTSGYPLDYFRQGFNKAADLQPLEQTQVGQRGQATVSMNQILGTEFAGLNQPLGTTPSEDKAAVQLATQARTAGLSGGGGFTQNVKGGLGIGRAGTEGQGK